MAHSHKEGGAEGFLGASFYELWELLCPLAYEWKLCVCVWPSTSDGCAVVGLQQPPILASGSEAEDLKMPDDS